MKTMNDNELDDLIRDTLQRDAMLDDIQQQVMQTLKRDARRAQLRQWCRIVAFSFGLPLATVVMLMPVYYMVTTFHNVYVTASMAFYFIAVIGALVINGNNFSDNIVIITPRGGLTNGNGSQGTSLEVQRKQKS